MARKDDVTLELPGIARRRGRPATGKALSGKQRQASYREKLRESGRDQVTVVLSLDLIAALEARAKQSEITLGSALETLIRPLLCTGTDLSTTNDLQTVFAGAKTVQV